MLGSVQRYELIKMIDKHIGREKRLEVAAKWRKEAEEREEQERLRKIAESRQRRPSRFEVVPAPDIIKLREMANNEMLTPQAKKDSQPKSILKKTNSFTMKGFSPLAHHSPLNTPYSTITGAMSAERKIRAAFDQIFRKSTTLQDVTPDPERGSIDSPSISGLEETRAISNSTLSKKVQLVI